ncbi:MAG: D-proline reductase (dithiol) PrdB [Gammaproteobacteria bacterium]|jgi:D-proline reductase (dithiol) PrdB
MTLVRSTDLSPAMQKDLHALQCPAFDSQPWVAGVALAARRVAIISSAGLMMRGERPVTASDVRYRAIAHDADARDVLMSHVSVNYDRTGFQRDMNVVFPRDRLQELVDEGVVGSAASKHYATMGAVDPAGLERQTRDLVATLHADGVDSAVLLPV